MWVVKGLIDTLLEISLRIKLKLYEFEWCSFYSNVPGVVNFNLSREFSI